MSDLHMQHPAGTYLLLLVSFVNTLHLFLQPELVLSERLLLLSEAVGSVSDHLQLLLRLDHLSLSEGENHRTSAQPQIYQNLQL